MNDKNFKDQCDCCKKFDYLVTINGKCVCNQCLSEFKFESTNYAKKQLSIFDYLDEKDTKKRK